MLDGETAPSGPVMVAPVARVTKTMSPAFAFRPVKSVCADAGAAAKERTIRSRAIAVRPISIMTALSE
jgi:hypothetical protein